MRPRLLPRRLVVFVAGVLTASVFVAACGSSDAADRSRQRDKRAAPRTAVATPGCPAPNEPSPPRGPSAQAITLRDADTAGPRVEAVVYPRPDYKGGPWSQWGQGLVLADGRYLSAMGDHLGADGNSFLFVYEPESGTLTRFTDVLSHVEHTRGEWGYGKIHGQLVAGRCGEVYVPTYWGTRRGLRYTEQYRGDVLFRLDAATLELTSLGSPLERHGLPSLAGYAPDGLVYGEAVDPGRPDRERGDQGAFFVYDTERENVVFRSNTGDHVGFRNVLVSGDGTAYVAGNGGRLLVYESGARELVEHRASLPGGGSLRASTVPGPDGSVYGVTQDPNRFFALRPNGDIDDLGAAPENVTSLALQPDGRRFFFVPGAHGAAPEFGSPLMAVDTKTGKQTTVVELLEPGRRELGLVLGGSYSVAVDPSGDRVYVGFNAGKTRDDPWGEVVLAVVHLR